MIDITELEQEGIPLAYIRNWKRNENLIVMHKVQSHRLVCSIFNNELRTGTITHFRIYCEKLTLNIMVTTVCNCVFTMHLA